MNYSPFFKLEIFCPEENVNEILEVLAKAHAGEVGKYDHCSTILQVQSSYRPLDGAKPAFGEVGKLILGTECKIEMNCREEYLVEAIQAVRVAHPYEEPVINVIPLSNHNYGATD